MIAPEWSEGKVSLTVDASMRQGDVLIWTEESLVLPFCTVFNCSGKNGLWRTSL